MSERVFRNQPTPYVSRVDKIAFFPHIDVRSSLTDALYQATPAVCVFQGRVPDRLCRAVDHRNTDTALQKADLIDNISRRGVYIHHVYLLGACAAVSIVMDCRRFCYLR